jgi:hypothetical protein
MTRIVLGFALAFSLGVGAAAVSSSQTAKATSSDLVSFKVAARDSTGVILLVPASATEANLTNLVNALRTGRGKGTLGTFFPPTTPGGSKGPYAAAAVFVMSDPVWATTPRLKAFSNPTTSGISAAEKEFGKRVRAYYFFTAIAQFQEFGTLGYEDEGHQYTATYKKLF